MTRFENKVSLSSKSAKTFDALKDLMDDVRTYCKHQQWLQKVSVPGESILFVSGCECDCSSFKRSFSPAQLCHRCGPALTN